MSPAGGPGARRLRGRLVGANSVHIDCSCGTSYDTDVESIENGWAKCPKRGCKERPSLDEIESSG